MHDGECTFSSARSNFGEVMSLTSPVDTCRAEVTFQIFQKSFHQIFHFLWIMVLRRSTEQDTELKKFSSQRHKFHHLRKRRTNSRVSSGRSSSLVERSASLLKSFVMWSGGNDGYFDMSRAYSRRSVEARITSVDQGSIFPCFLRTFNAWEIV